MPGPVGLDHGEAHVPVIVCLSDFAEETPGVRAMNNATRILGWKSEPQPDGWTLTTLIRSGSMAAAAVVSPSQKPRDKTRSTSLTQFQGPAPRW